MASDQDIVAAARALKQAHMRADLLGGDHSADMAKAFSDLLAAVGEVDEPPEVTERLAELEAERQAIVAARQAAAGQIQAVTVTTEGQAQP